MMWGDPKEVAARMSKTGVEVITEFLEGKGISYEVVEHERTMSAAEEAQATHRRPEGVAKTVVLRDGQRYVLAVIPASERLDLHKVREVIGASKGLRLATEEEMAEDFRELEVGAVPPIGPMLPAAEVIDRRLLDEDRILCAGGDHRHSIVIDPRDVSRVTDAAAADIVED
jgi:Ala-tRNA(Pro) deacylase